MVISAAQLSVYLLIFARLTGLFASAPLFNTRFFPAFAKVAFLIWVTAVFWFVAPVSVEKLPVSSLAFFASLISELIIGLALGFITNLIFLAIQASGEIADMQMGLSVAQAFDPVFGASISVVGRMLFNLVIVVFLSVNGHHMLLSAIHQSFRVIPVGETINLSSPALAQQLIDLGARFWFIALQFAGPIVLIIFLSDFAFGIVSRVAPQVNVFMLGFQVKPSLGLIGYIFIMPLMVNQIANLVGVMSEQMIKLLAAIR